MDARDRHHGQRDKRTNGRTDEETRRSSVRLLDGVLTLNTRRTHLNACKRDKMKDGNRIKYKKIAARQ